MLLEALRLNATMDELSARMRPWMKPLDPSTIHLPSMVFIQSKFWVAMRNVSDALWMKVMYCRMYKQKHNQVYMVQYHTLINNVSVYTKGTKAGKHDVVNTITRPTC